jgi:CRISPR-associated protein (TIGR02710 family)
VSNLSLLEEKLKQVSDRWQSLPLETREQQVEGIEFYSREVFPLIKQVFVARESPKIRKPILGLILPVGTSPEPLVLSISAIKPERVLFLHTHETEYVLDAIIDRTNLKARQWDKRTIDPADPTHIYREIKEAWIRWGRRRDIAVDFTGGTKSMSGGAAMAGALLGAQLVYIANRKYLPDPYRRPEPGSEYLEFVPNPYLVFGDLEEMEAANRFHRFDFAGAAVILENLAEKAVYPRRYQALASLAAAYKAWDDLDFSQVCSCVEKTINAVEALSHHKGMGSSSGLVENIQLLSTQLKQLEDVARLMPSKYGESTLPLLQNPDVTASLLLTIYASAERKETRREFDTASLLLYRLVELMAQRRLASYSIDTGDPDYAALRSFPQEQLVEKINGIREDLKWHPISNLPRPISLADGYMLLEALNDPYGLRPAGVNWKKFLAETRRRNHSILAHGFIFIPEEQYIQFKQMVDSLLDLFCTVEGLERSRLHQEHAFIDPWLQV